MDFGQAIVELKRGQKVARRGWNGKNMWIMLVIGSVGVSISPGTAYSVAGLTKVNINSHIDMMTASGDMQPGWLASQQDILAEDWEVIYLEE